jgi:hypothetical protein
VTPVVDGAATYRPRPLEPPAVGSLLICVAQPDEALVLDL